MSVLLGLLSQRDVPTRRIILGALPESSTRAKLEALIAAIREFTTFYGDLAKKMAQAVARSDRVDDVDMDADCNNIDMNLDLNANLDDCLLSNSKSASAEGFGKIMENERVSRTLAREHDKGSEVANAVIAFLGSLRDT